MREYFETVATTEAEREEDSNHELEEKDK